MHLTTSYSHKRLALLVLICLLLILTLVGLQRVQAESAPHAGAANTQGTIVADSYVSEGSPSSNYGSSTNLLVGHTEFLQESYSLVKFNLPSLPAGAVIDYAELQLQLKSRYGYATEKILAYQIASNWGEGSVTWSNRPALGGELSSAPVGTSQQYYQWDVTSLVGQWYEGKATNYGIAVRKQNVNTEGFTFSSRETAQDPKLIIYYTEPTSTSTPTKPPTATRTPTKPPTATQTPTKSPTATATPKVENTLPGQIYFDRIRYRTGESIFVTVNISGTMPASPPTMLEAVLSDPKIGDSERVLLYYQGGGKYASRRGVPLSLDAATPDNEVLEVKRGDLIYALYGWTGGQPGATGDLALVSGGTPSGQFTYVIDPNIMYGPATLPGRTDGEPERPIGAVAVEGYPPVRFGTDVVIFQPRNDEEKDIFLARRKGTVAQSHQEQGEHAVRIDLSTQDLDDFEVLADHLGVTGKLIFSSQKAALLYNLVLEENLDGMRVTLNPLLTFAGGPEGNEDPSIQPFDQWWANDPTIQLDHAWVLSALMDIDLATANLALIDGGFRTGPDVPPLVDGWDFEDDDPDPFGPNPASCSGTVPCPWHGDEMWGIAGGVVNNEQNLAGTGGQVARPMFYRVGYQNWVFDTDTVIRRAADHGADVINISAGFPCRLGGISYCEPAVRASICAGVIAVLPLLGGLLPPEVLMGMSVFSLPLDVFCFNSFNPQTEITDAVAYARSRNTIVVAAAGNEVSIDGLGDFGPFDAGEIQMVPCVVDGVICVGEMDSGKNNLNNWGNDVDIWGPTGLPASGDVTVTHGGTSGATSYMSGVVALLKAVDPSLTPSDVRSILQSTGHTSPTDPLVHHYVDVYDALVNVIGRVPARQLQYNDVQSLCPSVGWDEVGAGNDDRTIATLLASGAGDISPISQGAVHPFNDLVDWYRFDLPDAGVTGQYYHVAENIVDSPRLGALSRSLYTDDRGLGPVARNVWPGTYYLKTWFADTAADTCYALDGRVDVSRILPDRFEPNNLPEYAAPADRWRWIGARTWEQRVDNLSFHAPRDRDFFTISPPAGAAIPGAETCSGTPPPPGGGLTINIVRSGANAVARFTDLYDRNGSLRTTDYTGSPTRRYLPPELFFDASQPWAFDQLRIRLDGDDVLVNPDGYALYLRYQSPQPLSCDTWERVWTIIEEDMAAGGAFRGLPERPDWGLDLHYPIDAPCNPMTCDQPSNLAADYVGFGWAEAADMTVEAHIPADGALQIQLMDLQGRVMGIARPVVQVQSTGDNEQTLRLKLSDVPAGYYLLKISDGDFGIAYDVKVLGQPWKGYLPMLRR